MTISKLTFEKINHSCSHYTSGIINANHFLILLLLWGYSPGWALASLKGFITISFLQGQVVRLTPNPQPEGPGYPHSSGPSPSTCPARVALPVANATAGIALRIIWPRKPSHPALVIF